MKRILSMMLVVLLVLGMLPGALAQETAAETEAAGSAAKPIVLDFMEFARQAAKQDFYTDLTDATVEGIKVLGTVYNTSSTDREKAAYAAMQQWLEENFCWKFDESGQWLGKGSGRRLFINNGRDNYGLRVYTQFLNRTDGRSGLFFAVNAPQSGTYVLDVNFLQEAVSTSVQGVSGTAGGGVANVYLNGELIYEELNFGGKPDNTVAERCLGAIYLKEGENQLKFDMIKDALGGTNNGRRAANLRSITFTPLTGVKLPADGQKLLDLRDTYVAFDADVSGFAVTSSDRAVSASFDADGNLLICAKDGGSAELTVTNGNETICTIPVQITDQVIISDLSENVVEVIADGWYSPTIFYYALPNGAEAELRLNEMYLGTAELYAESRNLETALLRPVYLKAGTYELSCKTEGKTSLQALELMAIDEPQLTITADDLTEKPLRLMETKIWATWDMGLADDLTDAEWEVEVSDDTLLQAEMAEDILQVTGLKPGEGTVTVTADVGGAEASVVVQVKVSEPAALSSMEVKLKGVDKGIIAQNTNQQIAFTMVGSDGDVIYPEEANITYSVSSSGIVEIDEENHVLRGAKNGDVTVNITAEAGGVILSDSLELTVADVGENRWSDRNSYFEEGNASWAGFLAPNEKNFITSVVEDGAAKITLNPNVSWNDSATAFEMSLANGQFAALEPGHIYEMTFRFKVEGYKRAEGAQNDPRFIVQVYDYHTNARAASPIGQYYSTKAVPYMEMEEGKWQTIALPVYAPIDTAHTIYVMPRIVYSPHYASTSDGALTGFEGTFWLDDIEIREVSFGYVDVVLAEEMTTITRPSSVTLYPYTNTGNQIRPDAGIWEGKCDLRSSDEDVVKVNGEMYIQDADYEYPSWNVQLVGLNNEAELIGSLTIGDETREGKLDIRQTDLPEVLRDVHYTLDGFDSLVLKKGEKATGSITGRTTQLTPIAEDGFASVYFMSSDPKVATVDAATGIVTCVGEGIAEITAYGLWEGQSKKDTAIITVTDDTDLVSIQLVPEVDFVAEQNFLQMYAEGSKASGGIADMSLYPVAWTVSDEAIATIDETGRLYGLKAGTVTVTATVGVERKAVSASMEVTVIPNGEQPGGIDLRFNYGGSFVEDPTLEEHGYEIDYDACYDGGKKIVSSTTGYEQKVPAGGVLAFDLMVKRAGWYQLEVRGRSLYYLGNLNHVFMDDAFMGEVDFGSDLTSNYGGGGVLNAVWLDAGVHSLRLVAQEGGRTQFVSRIALHPISDPKPVTVEILADKTELVVGESISLTENAVDANGNAFYMCQQEEPPEYTNYCMYSNSDPKVASFDGRTMTALQAGETTITLTCEVLGETVTAEKTFLVKEASFVSAELTAERTTVRPGEEPFALTLTTYDLDGTTQESIPTTAAVIYESGNTAVATVGQDGIVTLTGKLGSAEITATLTEGERTVKATVWITVTEGKTEPTLFTNEERAIAQENVLKYDWAWKMKEKAVKDADYYVENLDQIYDSWIHEGLPRNIRVGRALDDTYKYCRYCGEDLVAQFGVYPYLVDPIENPWKITCPVCKRDFPSNDFGAYYASGLGDDGKFYPEKADRSLLTNDLYPEMGEGWGVDDGFGYHTGMKDSDGTDIVYTFIAYYNACIYWGNGANDKHSARDIFTALQNAYIYTGDEKYGQAGAILVDKLADVYPDYDLRQYPVYDYSEGDGDGGNGKMMGLIWEGLMIENWAKAVDAFWPCMDDPEVVEFLKARASVKGLTPEDITPEYIRDHAEQNILLEIFDAVKTNQANGNTGIEESGLACAAVAIGHEPERTKMLNWLNAEDKQGGNAKAYTSYHTGAGLRRMLVEDISRDGISYEGSISYAALWDSQFLELAEALEGVEGFDLWDNQKFVNLYLGMMRLTVLGCQAPQTQESAGIYQSFTAAANVDRMLTAFLNTGNRDLARAIYAANGNSVNGLHGDIFTKDPESGVRSAIMKIVNEDGIWDMSKSDMLCGYGIAILREGPEVFLGRENNGKEFSDYWMSFCWSAIGHTQVEMLNIDVEAFGLTLSGGTMGYPTIVTGSDPTRMQWIRNTVSHNCVVVNDRGQDSTYELGFPKHFADDGRAKVMDVEAPQAYNETDIYRRTVVAVDNGDGVHYAVDFFRVLGGSEHVYSFHGATRIDPTVEGLTMTKQPFGTYAGADVPFGADDSKGGHILNTMSGYSWLYNVSRDNAPETTFSVDWKIEDFHDQLTTTAGIHLKLTMLSEDPMTEVALADGQPPQDGRNPDHVEFMLARRSGQPGMDSLFTSVIEPYQFESYIDSAELVSAELIKGTPGAKDRAAAIKTTLKSGRVDYIIYSTASDCTYRIDDKFDFCGFAGVISYENDVLTYAWGNEATTVADVIEDALPRVTGTVTDFTQGINMDGYTMTVSVNEAIKEEDLIDRYIYVNNDGTENAVYRIYGAEVSGSTAILDLHSQTLVREMVSDADPDAGVIHNIAPGQSYIIPLSAAFNMSDLFTYTADKVIRAGNKLSVIAGVSDRGAIYEAEGLMSGMKLDKNTGALTWTTSRTNVGKYPIIVKAIDADGDVIGTMGFVVYVVPYTGSTYAPDKCTHSKAVVFGAESVCPACGTITRKAEEEIEKFDVVGSNMTLGNELKLNVLVKSSDVKEGYTAKIIHNGVETEQTFTKYNSSYHCVSVTLAAKQMADTITVVVYDKDGNAVSNVYETSVRSYAMRLLGMNQTAKVKTLVVDMLNYGAEAQLYFEYNDADLANSKLSDAQKAMASEAVICTNRQVKGKNFYGSNLALEDRVLLNLFFKNCKDGYTAKIIFTDFRGQTKTITKELIPYSGSLCKIVIDDIVLADAFTTVTATVYDGDGNVVGSATDSVESYIARTGNSALNEAIMKFAYSAKQYLS